MGWRWLPATACLLVAALFLSGCAEPPNKEMDQAQGAIDAALAAGASTYAATEYSAATDALKNATDAVTARDYRLALNYALESREHAQNAARGAADAKAAIRVEVHRLMAEIAALAKQGRARLAVAERARVPSRLLEPPANALAAADAALQEAGEAIAVADDLAARAALDGVKEPVETALAAIDAAMSGRSPRRRR